MKTRSRKTSVKMAVNEDRTGNSPDNDNKVFRMKTNYEILILFFDVFEIINVDYINQDGLHYFWYMFQILTYASNL